MGYKKKELQKDIEFLANRQLGAGTFGGHGNLRFTGISSNSIVAITYGLIDIKDQNMPSDASDVQSCINMWNLQMPEHRKTGVALQAYEAAINCDWYMKEKYTQCKNCKNLNEANSTQCQSCSVANSINEE